MVKTLAAQAEVSSGAQILPQVGHLFLISKSFFCTFPIGNKFQLLKKKLYYTQRYHLSA